MAVLERVATLIRANLNDLIDRAEDPEKMIKQVILDMENQLLQVKTQVAISMADQHLLQKKQRSRRTTPLTGCARRSCRSTRRRTISHGSRWSGIRASRNSPRATPSRSPSRSAGRRAAQRAPSARTEAGRGARQERSAPRAAPARPRPRARQRRSAGDDRQGAGRGLRSHAAEGDAERGGEPGKIVAGPRRRGAAIRGAGKRRRSRTASRRPQGPARAEGTVNSAINQRSGNRDRRRFRFGGWRCAACCAGGRYAMRDGANWCVRWQAEHRRWCLRSNRAASQTRALSRVNSFWRPMPADASRVPDARRTPDEPSRGAP